MKGRRAIVTGATRGIGAAIARSLDALGVHTLLVARDHGALAVMAAALEHATPLPEDLTRVDAAHAIAEAAPHLLEGPVDIVVNNAGIFWVASIVETNDRVVDEALAVNVAAPLRLARELLPAMRARGTGHIVTIGSVADRTVFAGNALYAASKHAARAVHEAIRDETRGTGVRATLVAPGPTNTPLWDAVDPDARPGFTPRASMLNATDVADAVIWVLSRDASVNVDELRLSRS